MKVVLVEDDRTLASHVTEFLSERGIETFHFNRAEDALAEIETDKYSVGVFDVVLPGMNGLTLLSILRGRGVTMPVLILSARDSLDDRIRGLQVGGDDYLCKPFSLRELEARIRAAARRTEMTKNDAQFLRVGDIEIDRSHRRVTRAGVEISLRPKEYSVLEYLCENPGVVVSKSMLLERVWGYAFDTGTNIIDVVVSRMRAKLENGFPDRLIRTVYGVGYVLESNQD